MGVNLLDKKHKRFIVKKGITWKLNFAAAPWWGGLFEWFVHSIKRCLKKLLKNLRFNYKQLLTLLAHIQAVINNRILAFIHEEPGEEVLTHTISCTDVQSILRLTTHLTMELFRMRITQTSVEYMNNYRQH